MSGGSEDELVVSGPPAEPVDPNLSVGEVILVGLKRWNVKATAQVEVETGRELTFGHLSRQSLSVVQGLLKEGIREGDILAIVSFNSQEAHVMLLACLMLGATPAPLDPALNPEEMSALLELIGARAVYTEGGKTLRKVETALALLSSEPEEPLLIVSGRNKHPYLSFTALLQPTDPEFRPGLQNPEGHVALILFTSGTSGLPKAVMIPDRYLISSVSSWPVKHANILMTAPIFWLSGIITFMMAIALGLKVVFFRGPAKEAVILSAIQNYQVNIWPTAPTTLQHLLVFPSRHTYDTSSLQWVLCGGAGMSAESQLRVQRELFRNKTMVTQGYGMTEIGMPCLSLPTPQLSKPGAVGMIKAGMHMKIEDVETGECLGPEREGEVCFKSDNMMLGYLKNEEATKKLIDEDGWAHTGDVGYYDTDGFLYIVDRLKDLIKYKSYQIAPAELENILLTHPAVKDAVVIGVPHATDGEHATAFVVAHKPISENQLLEFVAERVNENKQLRGGIRFVESIPRTATGKSKRRVLKAQLLSELQGINFIKEERRKRWRMQARERSTLRTDSPHYQARNKRAPP